MEQGEKIYIIQFQIIVNKITYRFEIFIGNYVLKKS